MNFQHQMMIQMQSKLEILQSFQQLTKVITNQFMSQKQAHLHPLVGYFYQKKSIGGNCKSNRKNNYRFWSLITQVARK